MIIFEVSSSCVALAVSTIKKAYISTLALPSGKATAAGGIPRAWTILHGAGLLARPVYAVSAAIAANLLDKYMRNRFLQLYYFSQNTPDLFRNLTNASIPDQICK